MISGCTANCNCSDSGWITRNPSLTERLLKCGPRLSQNCNYVDCMNDRSRRFRTVALVFLASACVLFSIFEVTTAWEFDYFGWHSRARWFVDANEYKSKVMREPLAQDGSLRHVEWEGWGWAGVGDTVTYLVFDPSDRLKDASTTGLSGQYQGIHCSVLRVRQLEKNWYTVRFYTQQDWSHCE
jgi:hypothetical protein